MLNKGAAMGGGDNRTGFAKTRGGGAMGGGQLELDGQMSADGD